MNPKTKPVYDLIMRTIHAVDAARRSLSPNEDRSLSEAEGTAIDLLQSLSREITDGEISQFYVAIDEQTKELIEISKRIAGKYKDLSTMLLKTVKAVSGLINA
jgi:hypothetical protein